MNSSNSLLFSYVIAPVIKIYWKNAFFGIPVFRLHQLQIPKYQCWHFDRYCRPYLKRQPPRKTMKSYIKIWHQQLSNAGKTNFGTRKFGAELYKTRLPEFLISFIMRSTFFWDVTPRQWIIGTRRFGT
jgi:hypothetical protein